MRHDIEISVLCTRAQPAERLVAQPHARFRYFVVSWGCVYIIVRQLQFVERYPQSWTNCVHWICRYQVSRRLLGQTRNMVPSPSGGTQSVMVKVDSQDPGVDLQLPCHPLLVQVMSVTLLTANITLRDSFRNTKQNSQHRKTISKNIFHSHL